LALPLVAGLPCVASAEDDITPRVSTGLTLTDNRDFEHDAESDAIFSITPGVNIREEGGRSQTFLDYSFSGQYAHRDTEFDVVHNLSGTNSLEILEDSFWVESSAAVDQQLVDNTVGVPGRVTESGNNLSMVQRYEVSPVYRAHLGRFADSESRLRLGYVTSTADDFSDETEFEASQELFSGRDFTSFTWTASAVYLKGDGDDEDHERQTYRYDTATFITREVTLLGGIGYEQINDPDLDDEPKGFIWDAGLRLKPGPKLTMEATYGERFEETNIAASLDYRITSRTSLNIDYSQDLTTEQQLLLNDLGFIGVDENGNLIDTRTGELLDDNFSLFGLTDDTFRRDLFTIRFSHTRPRDRYTGEASYEIREGGNNDESEKIKSLSTTWSHDLTRTMTWNTTLNYDNIEFSGEDAGRTDNIYTLRTSLTEQIFEDVDATATYFFRHLDSNESDTDATENALLFTLTKTF
jgi:uncharacterized protein (PEP-CTERM system associated)